MKDGSPNADSTDANRRTDYETAESEFVAAFSEAVNNGRAINWKYWAEQMPHWTAAQAARLICALDPDVFENLDHRPNKNDPSDLTDRAKKIQRLAEAQDTGLKNPDEWLNWAESLGLHVHPGLRLAINALSTGCETHALDNPISVTAKGITKNEAVTAFGHLVSINLEKALADGVPWVLDARASKGAPGRGQRQSMWNPVILATAIYERKHAPKSALSRAFFENSFLAEWRDEWKMHETDLL